MFLSTQSQSQIIDIINSIILQDSELKWTRAAAASVRSDLTLTAAQSTLHLSCNFNQDSSRFYLGKYNYRPISDLLISISAPGMCSVVLFMLLLIVCLCVSSSSVLLLTLYMSLSHVWDVYSMFWLWYFFFKPSAKVPNFVKIQNKYVWHLNVLLIFLNLIYLFIFYLTGIKTRTRWEAESISRIRTDQIQSILNSNNPQL